MISKNEIKIVKCIFCMSIFLSIVLCFLIARHQTAYKKIIIENETELIGDVNYCIDNIGVDQMQYSGYGTAQVGAGYKYYIIQGWAGEGDEDIKLFNTKVLLKPQSSKNEFYVLKTEMVNRPDLESYGESGVSYELGGFVARIKRAKLKKDKYNIFLYYCNDQKEILVKTNDILEVK